MKKTHRRPAESHRRWLLNSKVAVRLLESSTAIVLAVVAFGTILALALSSLGVIAPLSNRSLLITLLTIVSGLSVVTILERVGTLRNIEADLSRVDRTVAGSLGGVYLRGRDVIYAHSLSTIRGMDTSLVSVLVGSSPRAPDWWFDGVIERLAMTKELGDEATWKIYLKAAELEEDSEAAEYRRDAIVKAGVANQVQLWHVRYLEDSGWDFFIVDGRHVYLTLPSDSGLEVPRRAIFFQDRTELARQLQEWVDGLNRSDPKSPA